MAEHDETEKNEEVEVVDQEVDQEIEIEQETVSELDQLRSIVFGAAKADLDAHLVELQKEMRAGFDQAAQELREQVAEMQAALKDSVDSLDNRITWVDSQHDDKTADLSAYADKLASEIEMNDTSSKQQDDELQRRLEEEVQDLTDKFTRQHDQTIELLNQVKQELNTSKTDRKTLARLLATVASNLETDEDDG
ncbi:hypothetical protein [Vibrio sp. HN007]|uniref:hypothetical protein n=1 Tax=Vibrio iocasae TaxID=3098914 RepID=UPI0035D51C26